MSLERDFEHSIERPVAADLPLPVMGGKVVICNETLMLRRDFSAWIAPEALRGAAERDASANQLRVAPSVIADAAKWLQKNPVKRNVAARLMRLMAEATSRADGGFSPQLGLCHGLAWTLLLATATGMPLGSAGDLADWGLVTAAMTVAVWLNHRFCGRKGIRR